MPKALKTIVPLLALTCLITAESSDWPRFLGPGGNGVVLEDDTLNADWAANPPKILWTRQIGLGCSSFAVADSKALSLGNTNNQDTVWCFDTKTGTLIWKHTYDEPKGAKYYSGGTSSTPTIDEGRVYTVSKQGKLFCLDLGSGKVIWERNYSDDFDGRRQSWGWAASPVVYKNLLLIDPGAKDGALVALDKNTGETVWKIGTEEPGYSTPVVYQDRGRDRVSVFHKKALVGYDLEGPRDPLFRYSWRTSYGANASNPHFREGKFYISSGYGSGYAVIDVTKPEPELLHRDRELILKVQTSILFGDHVIAHYGGDGDPRNLVALNFDSGEIAWKQEVPGDLGNVIAIGDHLIVFTDSGHVILGKDQGDHFQELGRKHALQGTSWAPPAYANGRLYLRNNLGKAICLDVSKAN